MARGVVAISLRDLADPVHERERGHEVREVVALGEVMLVDHQPARELVEQRGVLLRGERGHPAPARHALALGERTDLVVGHGASSLRTGVGRVNVPTVTSGRRGSITARVQPRRRVGLRDGTSLAERGIDHELTAGAA
jgi:hypothetical protein